MDCDGSSPLPLAGRGRREATGEGGLFASPDAGAAPQPNPLPAKSGARERIYLAATAIASPGRLASS